MRRSGSTFCCFFSHQCISQRPRETIGPNFFLRVYVPEVLRKSIATWDFPGGSGPPAPPPSLDTRMARSRKGKLYDIWCQLFNKYILNPTRKSPWYCMRLHISDLSECFLTVACNPLNGLNLSSLNM